MTQRLNVVSGATGMTGSELCRRLIAQNERVLAFDNFFASDISSVEELLSHPLFSFHEYDINNSDHLSLIEKEIRGIRDQVDEVLFVNCAAVVHTEHFYHIDHTFTTNVLGMKAFLDLAICVGASTFINCSTSEVYSMQSFANDGGVSEDAFLLMSTAEHSQRTSYATGKLLTEFFIKDAVDLKKIKGCSIRFANVYSDKEKLAKHIIPHVLTSLRTGKVIKLLNNAKTTYRTFLHNIDSCRGVLALMASPHALDGTVYNLATDEEISILALVELVAKKVGTVDYEIVFEDERKSDPPRRLLNTQKIRMATSWSPIVSLEHGLNRCIAATNGNIV